jgi:hypothetical protein
MYHQYQILQLGNMTLAVVMQTVVPRKVMTTTVTTTMKSKTEFEGVSLSAFY